MSKLPKARSEHHAADVRWATEVMLDAMRLIADGKDEDDLVFVEDGLRAIADELGLCFDEEIEPMTAGEFRRLHREARGRLAREDT